MNDCTMHRKARTWQKLLLSLQRDIGEQGAVTLTNIEQIAIAYLDFTVLNKGVWCMLFEHQLPVEEPVPDWYLQENKQVLKFVYCVLKRLNTRHSDEQVRLAAQTLIISVQGVCMQLVIQQQTIENIKAAKVNVVFLVDCFMRGWIKEVE